MSSRRAIREESWDNLVCSEDFPCCFVVDGGVHLKSFNVSNHGSEEGDLQDRVMDRSGTRSNSPALRTIGDVHRALHPLQATADRVGKQVEQFAETLDRLSTNKPQQSSRTNHNVLPLIQGFEKIANDAVTRLKKYHEPERQDKLKRSWKRRLRNSSGRSTPIIIHEDDDGEGNTHTSLQDLQRWEQERQTWQLLSLMIQIEHPVRNFDAPIIDSNQRLSRPKRDTGVHRYSTEHAVWQNFLAEDDEAWERHVIVEWLKNSAEGLGQDIETVIEQLDVGADRGSGVWSHGWLYSKEAIKGQKRLRSWPQALEPDSPGIDTSLVNAERTQSLITQLDPDAITRQSRSLEKEDLSFERATWLACYEFLRRGRSWDSIREWCQERVEVWRATAIGGDLRGSYNSNNLSGSPTHGTWQSRSLWRQMCAIAAREGGIDDFENAVYGILSGYFPSVEKVSRSWDDHLFAHYNSYVLHQFDQYLKNKCAERNPSMLMGKHSMNNDTTIGELQILSGPALAEKLRNVQAVRDEARQPMKMLQGSLIGKTFQDFVYEIGIQLAQSANMNGRSKIISEINKHLLDHSIVVDISMKDHDLLRILTHMIFIYQDLGFNPEIGDRQYAVENIIVAYIDYLSKAGKQQLIPIYASRLSMARSIECMGRQLPFVLDTNERRTLVKLMEQYGMDITGIFNMQLQMIILDTAPVIGHQHDFPKLSILDYSDKTGKNIHPILAKFMGNEINDDEQDLLHGFEWYLLLDGHWEETMAIGAIIYKHFLRTKSLAAARNLARTVTFSDISLSKTQAILGHAIDIGRSRSLSEEEYGIQPDLRYSTRSRSSQVRNRRRSSSVRRNGARREILLSHSNTFRDLENLFIALDVLGKWKTILDSRFNEKDTQHSRPWKNKLQKVQNELEVAIEPLLHGWLQRPKDDGEAAEFHNIRVACLPELILAYVSALHSAGRFLSRKYLAKSLDLAGTVAENGSDLVETFVAARRMSELVDALAVTSKYMLLAEEEKPASSKRGIENVKIWSDLKL